MIQLLDHEEHTAKVLFDPVAMHKIQAMARYTDTKEVALEGTVVRDEDTFYVTDVFAYPQLITAATVTSDDDEYVKWLNTLPDDVVNTKRFQVHSHVNMGATPSGVDTATYKKYLDVVDDFMIFMIVNRSGDYTILIYDVENNLIYDTESIEVGIILSEKDTDYSWYLEQMKMVKNKTAVSAFNKDLSWSKIYGGSYEY